MRSALGLLLAIALGAPAVSLTVSPKFAMRTSDVRFLVRLQEHPANRHLRLILDGPQYMAQDFELAGSDAPRIFERWFKSVPSGRYEAIALLIRSDRTRYQDRDTLCIAGMAEDCSR